MPAEVEEKAAEEAEEKATGEADSFFRPAATPAVEPAKRKNRHFFPIWAGRQPESGS